ncbi:transcription initiation factor IIA subunit 2 [Tanacetum coccineum]
MARDILTVPVSSVVKESVFETGRKEMDRYRLLRLVKWRNELYVTFLLSGQLKRLKELVIDAKKENVGVVPALVNTMLDRNLFLFGVSMAEALDNKVKTKVSIKGHLNTYRFCDNVWTFNLQDALVKYDESQENVGRGSPIPIGDGDGDVKLFPDGDGDGNGKRGCHESPPLISPALAFKEDDAIQALMAI